MGRRRRRWHHEDCKERLKDEDSGYDDKKRIFKSEYISNNFDFQLGCLGCCVGFLKERKYSRLTLRNQFDGVCYIKSTPDTEKLSCSYFTKATAKIPSRGIHGQTQVKSIPEDELYEQWKRTVQNHKTYQIYDGGVDALGKRHECIVRLESVGILEASSENVLNIRLSIIDATMIELHRKEKGRKPLSRKSIKGYFLLD